MKAIHRAAMGLFLVPALAAAAVAMPTATASADTSTICTSLGLPTETFSIGQAGVVHVTVTTCGAAATPPTPACTLLNETIQGLVHVRVFLCPAGTTANSSGSPTGLTNGTTVGIAGLAEVTF